MAKRSARAISSPAQPLPLRLTFCAEPAIEEDFTGIWPDDVMPAPCLPRRDACHFASGRAQFQRLIQYRYACLIYSSPFDAATTSAFPSARYSARSLPTARPVSRCWRVPLTLFDDSRARCTALILTPSAERYRCHGAGGNIDGRLSIYPIYRGRPFRGLRALSFFAATLP